MSCCGKLWVILINFRLFSIFIVRLIREVYSVQWTNLGLVMTCKPKALEFFQSTIAKNQRALEGD